MLIISVGSKDVAVEICEHGTDSTGKVMERLAWFTYHRCSNLLAISHRQTLRQKTFGISPIGL